MDVVTTPLPDDGHTKQEHLTKIGQALNPKYVDAKRIIGRMRWAAEDRLTKAHRMSDLVIRNREGAPPALAAFIYYFTPEQLCAAAIPRPSEWLLFDFVSGLPLARYECSENDFSTAPVSQMYSLAIQEEMDLSPEYYRHAYNLLDEVRIAYLKNGAIDEEKYNEYLHRILKNIPPDYRRFLLDLSDIQDI